MRRILVVVASVAVLSVLLFYNRPPTTAPAQTPPTSGQATAQPSGYVLQWDEGEKMISGLRRAPFNIKVSPKTGSQHLVLGTSQIAGGTGIPVHMHEHEDEILFVHRGDGTAVVGDKTLPVKEGATINVPRGTWHAVQNFKGRKPVEMLWIFSQPGTDEFFRELSVPVGAPPRQFTPKEIAAIDRKHGMRRKIP
jgi:mannose-6-phosphate isomerase-like protein (cupin superfamily)